MTQLVNQHTDLAEIFARKEAEDRRMGSFHPELLEISARWHRDMLALMEKFEFAPEAAHHRQQLQAVEAELARRAQAGVPSHG